MNIFASAGNKNSTNFKINFLAVVTPTINGKIHRTFILINFITKTMAKNDSKSLFRKNFSVKTKKPFLVQTLHHQLILAHLLIFLKKIRPVALILLASLGINSTLIKAPLPSNDRGEIRSSELSNKMLGIFSSMSCVIRNCTPLPDKASVTSSIGVAEIIFQVNLSVFLYFNQNVT